MAFDPVTGALIGSAVEGAGSIWGQHSANKANERLARENREWSERMSNSAIQRQMNDLRAAGINPILAGKFGGAPVPSATTASMQNELSGITGTTGKALEAMRTKADIAKTRTDTNTSASQAAYYDEQAKNSRANTAKTLIETKLHASKLPSESNKEAVEKGWLGRALAYVDRTSHSAGQIIDAINPFKNWFKPNVTRHVHTRE